MEAGDPSVSLDLLIRSLISLGASERELSQIITPREPPSTRVEKKVGSLFLSELKPWREVKLPAGKILPGVISHATDLVEHRELIADRIITFAQLVGQENVMAPTAASAPPSIRKSPVLSCAPCATARRSRAISCGVEFNCLYGMNETKSKKASM
jgi:hypothetical protein